MMYKSDIAATVTEQANYLIRKQIDDDNYDGRNDDDYGGSNGDGDQSCGDHCGRGDIRDGVTAVMVGLIMVTVAVCVMLMLAMIMVAGNDVHDDDIMVVLVVVIKACTV